MWQNQFAISFLTTLFIDVCIFETIECFWVHYVVPESVRKDVRKVIQVLQALVRKIDEPHFNTGYSRDQQFDSSSYFFASKYLAKLRPDLVESHLILAYRNLFPGMIWKLWPHYDLNHTTDATTTNVSDANHRRFVLNNDVLHEEFRGQLDPINNTSTEPVDAMFEEGRTFTLPIMMRASTKSFSLRRRPTTTDDANGNACNRLKGCLRRLPLTFVSGLSTALIFSLQSLGVLPFMYQKLVIGVSQSAIVSVGTMLYFWAYDHPFLFFVFSLFLLLILAIIVTLVELLRRQAQNVKEDEKHHDKHHKQSQEAASLSEAGELFYGGDAKRSVGQV
jgi:hypothetical protein